MINEKKPDFNNQPHLNKLGSIIYELNNEFDEPLISIVTPFYNTGKIFHETASSVLNQSFQQFEWIIVNDGSTVEESLRILEVYSNTDNRIRVINHDSNKGLSTARNTGIINASTEFILFIDSDDLIEPTAAEKWFWFLKTHPKVNFVDSYHVAFGGLNYLWTGGFHDGALNIEKNRISMLCMMKKSVYYMTRGFDEELRAGLEDWDFWLKCASEGIWGDTIPEYLAWYRIREDHSDRWDNLSETNLDKFRETIKIKYPELNNENFPRINDIVDLDLTQFKVGNFKANLLKKEKQNILIILPWMVMGGAERFILNLINQLVDKNWNISIVTTSSTKNEWKNEFEKLTGDIFELPNFLNILDYVDFINYFVFSRSIDVVFLQGSIEGYRMLPILRKTNPNLIITDYLHFVTEDWMDGGFPRLSTIYHEFLNKSIVSSKQLEEWLIENKIEEDKLSICYIGVDPDIWKKDIERRARFRKRHSIGSDEFLILYAGRLEDQKRPILLLDSMQVLNSLGLKIKMLIAGDGSLRFIVENKIQEFGLKESVLLLGSIPPDEMPDFLNSGDLFFLPSENEGISSAIYEAMAIGLPIVGTDAGGQKELVNEECGFLIDRESVNPAEKYAKIIESLILDQEKREKMSISCQRRIKSEFSIDLMGECINSILEVLIANNNEPNQVRKKRNQDVYEQLTDQLSIEYLQARNEWLKINKNLQLLLEQHANLATRYKVLIEPKKPSYWFYLWIRQLILPIYQKSQKNYFHELIFKIKEFIKNALKIRD